MTDLGEVASANYVLLTTYRKDGSPVGTPVWAVAHDSKLYVWTDANSWKVKRLQRNSDVTLEACNVRGATKPGAQIINGTARLLDAGETEKVRSWLRRKYWLTAPVLVFASNTFRGKDATIGIEVTPTA
jgi:PPOX class probable F420-dependent enzyme